MPEPSSGSGAGAGGPSDARRRRNLLVVGGVAAGVVVIAAVVLVAARGGGTPEDGPSAIASGTAGVSATAPPGATTPTPPPTSTPAATATGRPTPQPNQTWEPGPVDDPIDIDDEGALAEDVTARVARLEAVEGAALGPGQVAGPALRITLELDNGTAEAIPLNAANVQLYYGRDAVPGEPLSGPGVREFSGTLAPGDTATGVYVIAVPVDQRDVVQITFGYEPAGTIVAFEGSAPGE
jgi:hypothetical protein